MATYKPYRKTTNGKEEIKIPYSVLSNPPDLSVYAKLAGGNTFTGTQTLNSPGSGGYSINAGGYVKGSWLQASSTSNKGSNTGKVCVFDDAGWIYYRTPTEILTEAGGAKASDIPTDYVKYTAQTLTDAQKSQARSNIGAGTSNFDGTWGSLSGKPNVIQSTGNSTSDVMSQKAVTNELNKKANLAGDNTFSGIQTINAPTDVSGSEQTTMKVKTSNGGAIIFGKEGANSGTMIRLDQSDGTCRLRFRSSKTAGAMVWEQPEHGAKLHVDLGKDGSDKHRVTFPSGGGTLALTSQVNAKYTKPSSGIPKTDLESDVQTSLGKADTAVQSDALSVYAKKSDLAQVATSGNYNDLTNKPTIPTFTLSGTTLTITTN